ncbi:ubiquitin carboxyl-terminal hydrolase 1-like isoform X2 [Gigantopelta aegis]|uniref:ubiquitin carboxyl-terminal hydrolase 1-like isoform X2 n=1 Tax=Gigantopelta aegis TaxID=1735272 RepID=UPI001B887B6F|nr:ubiquitin carboxyl-terminal hydrolase 1-like isoform X2 [Gigantopelta aegis]
MVVANDEIPGPARKRPRLSLKSTFRKLDDVQIVPSCEQQGTTPQDIRKETVSDPNTGSLIGLCTDEDEDLADDSISFAPKEGPTVPPVSSLENIGNTCFFNSVLQVLRYTPAFLDGLGELFREIVAVEKTRSTDVGKSQVGDEGDSNKFLAWEFVKQLFTLYKSMEQREERYFEIASADVTSMAVKPDQLLDTIRLLNPMFEGNLQHDAQELLRCVLCYLEDAENELHKTQLDLLGKRPTPCTTTQDIRCNPIMQKFLDAGKKFTRSSESVDRAQSDGQGRVNERENCVRKSEDIDEIDGAPTGDGNRSDIQGGVFLHSTIEAKVQAPVAPSRTLRMRMAKGKNTCSSGNKFPRTVSSSSLSEQSVKQMDSKLVKSASENCLIINEKSEIACHFKTDKKPVKRLGIRRTVTKRIEENVSDGPTLNKPSVGDYRRTVDNEISFRINSESSSKLNAQFSGVKDSATVIKKENYSVAMVETNKMSSPAIQNVNFDKIDCSSTKLAKMTLTKLSPAKVTSNYGSATKSLKRGDSESPREMKVSLKKCDHVCNSPLKTVVATEAMITLGCARRQVNFDCDVQNSKQNENDDENSVDIYSDDSSDDVADWYLKVVPVKPLTVKVENCDSICNSPRKSVSAAYATKYLAGRKIVKIDFVERLFQGSMMLRTRCLECESSRQNTEVFQDVSVPLRAQKDHDDSSDDSESDDTCLSKLMSAFTEVERLRDDNKYFCDQCLCYVEAERSLHYDVLPNILTLHLKRFSTCTGMFGSHSVSKINDHVTIPLALPCLRYKCPKPCRHPGHRYTLFGIVTHAGMTISSGHYLSYVKVNVNCGQMASYTSSHTDSSKHFQQVGLCTGSGDNSLAQEYNSLAGKNNYLAGKDNALAGEDNSLANKDNSLAEKDIPLAGKDNTLAGKNNSVSGKDSLTGKDDSLAVKDNSLAGKDNPLAGKDNPLAGKDNHIEDATSCKGPPIVEWLECDDECIRVHSDKDFRNYLSGKDGSLLGSPYVLFYRKVSMDKLG